MLANTAVRVHGLDLFGLIVKNINSTFHKDSVYFLGLDFATDFWPTSTSGPKLN